MKILEVVGAFLGISGVITFLVVIPICKKAQKEDEYLERQKRLSELTGKNRNCDNDEMGHS